MRDLDLIRSYRSDVDTDEASRAAARSALRNHIEEAEAGRRAKRRLPKPARRLGLSVVMLLVATSGAAAAGLMLSSDDVSLTYVACLDSARTVSDAPDGPAHHVSAQRIPPSDDPVAACARRWRAGELGATSQGMPDLVACASAGDPIVVVPGRPNTCGRLGLEPLPGDYAPSASTMARAMQILRRDWELNRPRSACEPPQAAVDHARRLLQDAGVAGVRVELVDAGPCAGAPDFTQLGTVVRIGTVPHDEAGDNYEAHLIRVALEPLVAQRDCEDPQTAATRARHLLADAGLPHVRVDVQDPSGPCLDIGPYEHYDDTVTLLRLDGDGVAAQR